MCFHRGCVLDGAADDYTDRPHKGKLGILASCLWYLYGSRVARGEFLCLLSGPNVVQRELDLVSRTAAGRGLAQPVREVFLNKPKQRGLKC